MIYLIYGSYLGGADDGRRRGGPRDDGPVADGHQQIDGLLVRLDRVEPAEAPAS